MANKVESYFMTYGRSLLSGTLVNQTDLFLLELLRRDDIGYRAEGIFTAEKMIVSGKRSLIISGSAHSDTVNSLIYWDLAASESLHERIENLLKIPPLPRRNLDHLKKAFHEYCRPATNHHSV